MAIHPSCGVNLKNHPKNEHSLGRPRIPQVEKATRSAHPGLSQACHREQG
jgi:hypothetical protein